MNGICEVVVRRNRDLAELKLTSCGSSDVMLLSH